MITFDSLTLKKWLEQNAEFLTDSRVQKIQQPTRRDFIFSIRNNCETKKLYLNINPQYYHICFMNKQNENKRLISIPAKPPMFCMLLRKYLENAKIIRVNQPEFERILEFYFETYNELSEKIYICLAIELMGKHSNVILYNYDTNIILGCAHNVGADKSREREMAGGLPYVYPSGRPKNWYANENSFSSGSDCDINLKIDDYYAQYIHDDKIYRMKENCKLLVNSRLKKDKNSLKKIKTRLEKVADSDKYRLYGDLIMANLYNLKDYQKSVKVFDYENNKDISIELDPVKTLKENANNFYKLYNKAKTSVEKLYEFSKHLQEQILYYEQILYSIEIADSAQDLTEVKAELEPDRIVKPDKKFSAHPLELYIDGCQIWVGRNNRQNDYIVSKLAKDEDLWFHTKDCAGSHVLLRCGQPSDSLILKCAELAKEYSKGKESSKVGVIYTKRKFLKKPPGANLGYVTYKCEQEIIV